MVVPKKAKEDVLMAVLKQGTKPPILDADFTTCKMYYCYYSL